MIKNQHIGQEINRKHEASGQVSLCGSQIHSKEHRRENTQLLQTPLRRESSTKSSLLDTSIQIEKKHLDTSGFRFNFCRKEPNKFNPTFNNGEDPNRNKALVYYFKYKQTPRLELHHLVSSDYNKRPLNTVEMEANWFWETFNNQGEAEVELSSLQGFKKYPKERKQQQKQKMSKLSGAEIEKKMKDHENQVEPDPIELRNTIEELKRIDWSTLESGYFLELITGCSDQSKAFQSYLETEEMPEPLSVKLSKYLTMLLNHKFGCHLLRIAIVKSSLLFQTLKDYLKTTSLISVSLNEQSSRVLQVFATLDQDFICRFMICFSKNWEGMSISISAVFILASCLKNTKDRTQVSKIGDILASKMNFQKQNRFNKRILVNYLEYCDESYLKTFFSILEFENRFIERMDDKYMVYIFSVFLAREHPPAIETIRSVVNHQNFETLLKTAHFKFFISSQLSLNKSKNLRMSNMIRKTLENLVSGEPGEERQNCRSKKQANSTKQLPSYLKTINSIIKRIDSQSREDY